MARSFRDLQVWRNAMGLVVEIYTVTRTFPPDERFGLTSQLRRAAVSVPSASVRANGADDKRLSRITST